MLSSIHPLGERARNNHWAVTVGAFTIGAISSGALAGSLLGAVGSVAAPLEPSALTIATGVAALAAGLLDLGRVKAPGPERQVNENWIGAFRGWVYGAGFGLELGLGILTYLVTWGVYAMFIAALLTTSPLAGALVGTTFGLGRSASLLVAGWVDRPSRLTKFSRAMAQAGPLVRGSSTLTFTVAGVVVLAGELL